MDCKRALEDSGGDVKGAIEWLRKKGMASATKKEGRKSADGYMPFIRTLLTACRRQPTSAAGTTQGCRSAGGLRWKKGSGDRAEC
jgi:hypothetical protein